MDQKKFSFDNGTPRPDFPLEINGSTVTCRGEIDGLQLLDYMAVMNNPFTTTGQKAAAMTEWFRKVIRDDDPDSEKNQPSSYVRFQAIVAELRLDIEQLAEVSGYLSDCYSSVRPTEPASSSPGGQPTDGPGSEGSSSESTSG